MCKRDVPNCTSLKVGGCGLRSLRLWLRMMHDGVLDPVVAFDADRASYADAVQLAYDGARAFHDGTWIMFEPTDDSQFDDNLRMLAIKRRPNRKQR